VWHKFEAMHNRGGIGQNPIARQGKSIMEGAKFRKVAAGITNRHLKAIGDILNDEEILSIKDENGVPHAGYNKLI